MTTHDIPHNKALEALDSVAGKGKLCNTAITALTTALKGTP